jgi:hypothetical protein
MLLKILTLTENHKKMSVARAREVCNMVIKGMLESEGAGKGKYIRSKHRGKPVYGRITQIRKKEVHGETAYRVHIKPCKLMVLNSEQIGKWGTRDMELLVEERGVKEVVLRNVTVFFEVEELGIRNYSL